MIGAFLERLFVGTIVVFTIALVVALCVFVPTAMHVHATCLEAGYPRSDISWKLDGYCMNLEGTVTVAVDRMEDL